MTTEERFKRLEREVRWTRVGGAVMVVALACVVLVGAGQEQERVLDEVRAKAFFLVDDDGKVRAEWRQFENEQGLYFRNESGKDLVQLGSGRTDTAGILFVSPDGKSMSRLQVDGAGFPRLELIRASQKAASWHKAGEAEDRSEWAKLEVGRDGNVQLELKEMLKRKVVRPEE